MSEESTSITLRKSTKSHLQSLKGKKNWSTFLEEVYMEKKNKRDKNSMAKLRELLSDDDLDKIATSSKKFRKEFRLA